MQRLTQNEASILCNLLIKAKREILADQTSGVLLGAGSDTQLEQLRVIDKAMSLIVTSRPPSSDNPSAATDEEASGFEHAMLDGGR